MQLPSKVKIGPHVFEVVFPYVFTNNSTLCGQVDSTACEIRLASENAGVKYNATKVWDTFFHELAHKVLDIAGVDLGSRGENVCDLLAHTVLAMMIDNGWVVPEVPQ